jgi:hypothetical protein
MLVFNDNGGMNMVEKKRITHLFPIGGGWGHVCADCAAAGPDVDLYEADEPFDGYCEGCSDAVPPCVVCGAPESAHAEGCMVVMVSTKEEA